MLPETPILIVDDEPSIRFYLQEILTRDGYEVIAVESGEAALEQIAQRKFAVALLDLKMKGISGMEVLSVLRRQSPDTAVIVLTAHASLETAVEALRQGAHDYLFKPCKAVELRESMHRGLLKYRRAHRQRQLLHKLERTLKETQAVVTEQAPDTPPPPPEPSIDQTRFLRQGGLIVDLMRHVITLDGHLLELSPTELDLMAYLVSEFPRVVSPQELVREVQGYECDLPEARDVVRYHIYRIRRKIKQATGQSGVIRTVRGVGYAISE